MIWHRTLTEALADRAPARPKPAAPPRPRPVGTDGAGAVDLEEVERLCRHAYVKYYLRSTTARRNREDLLQEGRIAILYPARPFDPERGLSRVGFAIEQARRAMQNFLRRLQTARHCRLSKELLRSRFEYEEDHDTRAERHRRLWQQVEAATRNLEDGQLSLFRLRFLAGWEREEIAREYGLTAEIVRMREKTITEKLRQDIHGRPQIGHCKVCRRELNSGQLRKSNTCCSSQCAGRALRKIARPPKEEIAEAILAYGQTRAVKVLMDRHRCSDGAVKHWMRVYGLWVWQARKERDAFWENANAQQTTHAPTPGPQPPTS